MRHAPEGSLSVRQQTSGEPFSQEGRIEDVIGNSLEAVETNTCDTIVVGRRSHSWLRELVRHHRADERIRKTAGFTIWVVE